MSVTGTGVAGHLLMLADGSVPGGNVPFSPTAVSCGYIISKDKCLDGVKTFQRMFQHEK
jgi:hypothetical protein